MALEVFIVVWFAATERDTGGDMGIGDMRVDAAAMVTGEMVRGARVVLIPLLLVVINDMGHCGDGGAEPGVSNEVPPADVLMMTDPRRAAAVAMVTDETAGLIDMRLLRSEPEDVLVDKPPCPHDGGEADKTELLGDCSPASKSSKKERREESMRCNCDSERDRCCSTHL